MNSSFVDMTENGIYVSNNNKSTAVSCKTFIVDNLLGGPWEGHNYLSFNESIERRKVSY